MREKALLRVGILWMLCVTVSGVGFIIAACGTSPAPQAGPAGSETESARMLRMFNPILIQKLADDYSGLPYPMASDTIGRLSLVPDPEGYDYAVKVDTGSPVMYAFEETMTLNGRDFTQLVYAIFYPERPLARNPGEGFGAWFDRLIYSGLIDGKVVRITLDAEKHYPLFVEVVRNCGCSWQFYVNKMVENAARKEFEDEGKLYPGLVKPDAPHDVQYVWVLPEDIASAETRVVVVAEDGWRASPHHTLAVRTSYEQWVASGPAVESGVLYVPSDDAAFSPGAGDLEVRPFNRLNYDTLRTLSPEGSDEKVGIFDGYGYVWNAYSPLTKLMRAHGATTFPGTPRDPMHLEVVHETIEFWGSRPYERFIYLPQSIFGTGGQG